MELRVAGYVCIYCIKINIYIYTYNILYLYIITCLYKYIYIVDYVTTCM